MWVSTWQYLWTLSYTAPVWTINNTVVVWTIPVWTKFAVISSTSTANSWFYAWSVVIYTQWITEDTLQYRPNIWWWGNGWLTVRFNWTDFEIVAHSFASQVWTISAFFYW